MKLRSLALLTMMFVMAAVGYGQSPPAPISSASPAYTLVFDDEFNGTSLDTSKWSTGWFGSGITQPVQSDELECYDPAQVTVTGGNLNLTAISNPETCGGVTRPYASGIITTNGLESFTYGYYEARINVPASSGATVANWPAWWAFAANDEVDVLEGLDGAACGTFHSPPGSSATSNCASGNLTGWHTFGALWVPGTVTWYYDNVNIGSTSDGGITPDQMELVIGNQIGGAGGPVSIPSDLQVDYVHVWQQGSGPATYSLTTSTSGTGSGSVGGGANCPASGLTAGASYSCTATASGGSSFTSWSASTCGGTASGSTYSGTMPANSCNVNAQFTSTGGGGGGGGGGAGACPTGANYVNATQASTANAAGSLVTLSSLGVTGCYYISKSSGSDSNNGTSESTPWQHLPGMPDTTGVANSTFPYGTVGSAAGVGFILKGGDTWTAADLGVAWTWYGTPTNPFYIGVDPGWPSSGWTRPKWTCGGTGSSCSSQPIGVNAYWDDFCNGSYPNNCISYGIVDDLEVTGLYTSTTNYQLDYFYSQGSDDIFERIYAHGWSHAAWNGSGPYDTSEVFSPTTSTGNGGLNNHFLFNVVDGSDTSKDMMGAYGAGAIGAQEIAYGVISQVTNGVEGTFNSVHDTYFNALPNCFVPSGCHQNMIQQAGPVGSVTNTTIYNNVFTGKASGGSVTIWTMEAAVDSSAVNAYVFNNVAFNNAPGNDIDICSAGTNCGTHYYFNNTFECGMDSSLDECSEPGTAGGGGPTTVVYWVNNHIISGAANGFSLMPTSTNVTAHVNNNVTQTVAQASSQGYLSTSSYSFQPAGGCTSGTCSTLQAGTNVQAYCSAIGGFDTVAGAACRNGTGYAGTYNTSNHTVTIPALALVSRPATAAPDAGAYQSGGGGGGGTTYYTLTVSVSGGGSVGGGTNCSIGTNSLASGTGFGCNETPNAGNVFAGWSGGTCSGTASACDGTLTGNATVTANFTAPSFSHSIFSGSLGGLMH